MHTTDFPSLAVSLSMLAAPRQAARFTEAPVVEEVVTAPFADVFVEEDVPTEEEVFAVDNQGVAVEEDVAPAEVETDAVFAVDSTEGSGDLLEEEAVVETVPMPPPPIEQPVVLSTDQATQSVAQPVLSGSLPTYHHEVEQTVPDPEPLQPLEPHAEEEIGNDDSDAPAVDPNIAAIVFPKSPATTEAPVPSVTGFDPSRYFNFDDSEDVEGDLAGSSEFGVPPRSVNSPEALKALKELSAFRDR